MSYEYKRESYSLKGNTVRTDYPVHYHVVAVHVEHHHPSVIDDVHRLGMGMDEFDHGVRAFAVGAGRIGERLYLAKDAVDEIMAARRLEFAGDVIGYLVEVAACLIAHYHRVA